MKQNKIYEYFHKDAQGYADADSPALATLDPRDPRARRLSSSRPYSPYAPTPTRVLSGTASPSLAAASPVQRVYASASPAASYRDVPRSYASSPRARPDAREARRLVAEETLAILRSGVVPVPLAEADGGGSQPYDIGAAVDASVRATEFLADDDPLLLNWEELALAATERDDASDVSDGLPALRLPTNFGIFNRTTLSAARELRRQHPSRLTRIGVLNFASATKPGGGFLSGAEAQEESLARSSALYESLISPQGIRFYELHKALRTDGFYTHAMVYSPGVVVFRDDDAQLIEPYTVDMITSPAVNAGVVRQKLDYEEVERIIEREMAERMARILWLFQSRGCRHLVLGSFGTGVFQNRISMVASQWAELLALPHSKFFAVFERVEFAVLGNATFDEFRQAFEAKLMDLQPK
ncbi:hypothetical protein CALVIDRAFT_513566 [Calocera viscosa TUFC12733]|uniref:Microbial-type PARG catalytic domain-containing protein n=1 Tax=Calocera viscosa (strain TUFC12733) TaxID=1330018 RepID=A0A167N283_CALVF|nr:hypothetical protein CALVIDRAFT_513566 [Calocera viscosa TUFC12733]